MYDIAVVGTGIISKEHLDAIEQSDEFRLCALCDINEAVVKELSIKYDVPYFTDYHEMPEKVKIDAVILNLPHFLHKESTIFFLENGINVLVEKPMANSVKECDEMIAAAAKNNKKLAVGHIQRFFNTNIAVKKLFASKAFGELCMFSEIRTVDYFQESRPKWFLEKQKSGGGIVMNYGAHAVDKLSYLLGAFPQNICAYCGNIKNDCDIEGHAQILLEYPNNISASMIFSGYANSEYSTVYYFTNGAVRVTDTTKLSCTKDGKWIDCDICDDQKHMQRQLHAFFDYIEGNTSEIADGIYGREIIRVLEKCMR